MAIEFFTGFEGCAAGSDVLSLFDYTTSGGYLSTTDGFDGGRCTGGSGYLYDKNDIWGKSITATKTCAMGCHIKTSGVSNDSDEYIMQFIGPNVRLHNSAGGIRVYINGVYYASYGSQLPSNVWTHIEAKLFSDAAAGTLVIKVNGETICDISGVNTIGSDITQCRWCCSSDPYTKLDNFYIADDLQGELYSVLLKPASDNSTQFTPSTGSDNYSLLQSDDGDTSYVEADQIGYKDTYTYEDLDTLLVPKAVVLFTNSRKEGTGFRELSAFSVQDSVEYTEGSAKTLTTSYPNGTTNQIMSNIRSVAPDGSVWTAEILNNMLFGFEVTG